MKITDYEKVQALAASNIFLLDGPNGTKTIAADALAKALIGLLSSKDFIGGVNLSELTQVNALVSGNKLLVGTTEGNKAIAAEDALFAMLDSFAPVELRRVFFRGKNLGTALTAAQKAVIKDGSFKGMFLGDYWVIGGRTWRIVDMDYWYNCGDTAFTSHHLVIMPDEALYNAQMNTTNVTTGGYVGSEMYKKNLANAKTIVNAGFPGFGRLAHGYPHIRMDEVASLDRFDGILGNRHLRARFARHFHQVHHSHNVQLADAAQHRVDHFGQILQHVQLGPKVRIGANARLAAVQFLLQIIIFSNQVIINGGFQVTGDANAVFPQQQVTAIIGGFIHHAGTDALHHALFSLFGRQHAAADPFADIGNIVLQALGQGIVLDLRNFQQMLQQNTESIFIFHYTKSSSPI